jgi:LacI family transcriptional regulator
MQSYGVPVDERLLVGDSYGEQSGYIATKLLLKVVPDFTAILAFGNLISLGSIRALSEEGLKIPDDISIVSFDDQPYSAYLASPMTTVAQSSCEMGQIAFKLLFDRIHTAEKAASGGILLPTNLIIRESVRNLTQHESGRSLRHVCG